MSAGPETTARPPKPARRPEQRLRRRLPDLVLEAAMIFFALILALAAEEWRERQDRLELAERALIAVADEIRSNREELERNGPKNVERLQSATEVLARLEAGEESGDVWSWGSMRRWSRSTAPLWR